jgi:hypothetical protein
VRFGILITRRTSSKAAAFLRALHRSALTLGIDAQVSEVYKPCDVLVLYGLGGPDRQDAVRAHKGPFIAWDLGYWNRPGSWKLSFNDYHPTADVMVGEYPGHRAIPKMYEKSGDPDGPIMLVGIGPKSNAVGASGWVATKSKELREVFPGKKILYRPKPGKPLERGVVYDDVSNGPIDDALRGVSLVVCRHSNVAVDACRLGVPVVCEAGAASVIYPSAFDGMQPTPEQRREFINRLAWWQWSAGEADQAWQFIQGRLCGSILDAAPGYGQTISI